MKKRWTLREFVLLLLPVAALGAYGLWTSGKETPRPVSRSNSQPTFTLKSIEVVPATPLDVYEGFDTLVKVEYSYPPYPASFSGMSKPSFIDSHLVYSDQGVTKRVDSSHRGRVDRKYSDFFSAILRLRLSDVPARNGALTLESSMAASFRVSVRRAGGVIEKSVPIPPLPLSTAVRKAGEVVRVPDVPTHRPYRIKTIEVKGFESNPPRKLIKVTIEDLEPAHNATNGSEPAAGVKWRSLRENLVDEHGKEYRGMTLVNKKPVPWVAWNTSMDEENGKNDYVLWYSFPLNLMPKSAGKITFKALVSLNDCWPMSISYVVRR